MSRNPNAEMQVLLPNKFNEYCSVLGIKEMCCLEPDKKALEKAFRRKALKCHPDKGGDPVEFKKLNDAYNKLIGHIGKLEQQAEAIELANSVLIEISTASVKNWQTKLQTRYGWFKAENCKNIIFDGPYKQYMGRSKNTGNLTVVLYEDPPDSIPKIHIRSNKYMAWIAEQGMPVHMHVEKGRQLAFDQWRIAHLAEFGIYSFGSATPSTPAPERKAEAKPPKTPKSKRKGRDGSDPTKPKARRDSEPTPEPHTPHTADNKENTQPPPHRHPRTEETFAYNCGHCGAGFTNLLDYVGHKQKCVPDEDFSDAPGPTENANSDPSGIPNKSRASNPIFQCSKCKETFTNMVWYSKHQGNCTFVSQEDEYSEFMRTDSEPAHKTPEKPGETTYKPTDPVHKVPEKVTKPTQIVGENMPKTENISEHVNKISDKVPESSHKVAEKMPDKVSETTHKASTNISEPAKKMSESTHKAYKNAQKPSKNIPENVDKCSQKIPAKAPENIKKSSEKVVEPKNDIPKKTDESEKTVEEKPSTVRRFSAIIPDEPPQKFMETSQKDIPHNSCDQKKEVEVKHSKAEEPSNGVTKSSKKTKGDANIDNNATRKTNGVTELNDDASGRLYRQENTNIDEGKMRKTEGLGTKMEKMSKPSKPETNMRNGLGKAATSTVEAMEVDGIDTEVKVTGKGSRVEQKDVESPRQEPAGLY